MALIVVVAAIAATCSALKVQERVVATHPGGKPPPTAWLHDPTPAWLTFADFQDENRGTITKMNATWTVPSKPADGRSRPAIWFGLQTAEGDGALIQPVLKYFGKWRMFHEIFDYTDRHDERSSKITVEPGDSIFASLTYRQESNSYDMYMASKDLGKELTYNYRLGTKQTKPMSQAYFVLEHQPSSCRQLPENGEITFTDINLEVDGKPVRNAKWVAKQERPKCGSNTTIVDSTTVRISWLPDGGNDDVNAS